MFCETFKTASAYKILLVILKGGLFFKDGHGKVFKFVIEEIPLLRRLNRLEHNSRQIQTHRDLFKKD